jgi:Arginyl-tRNA synthetase
MFDEVKTKLTEFGVHFDRYFNEKELHDRGELATALDRLRAQGRVYEKDDATWIRTTDFDDDKDRVYVRSTGAYTYYAADCAYYLDKRERGFDKVVIMLGADHHGYIGRLRAMAASFGEPGQDAGDPHRPAGQPGAGRPAGADVQAGRHVVSLDDLVDAVGRGRRPVRAGPVLGGLADRRRPRPVDPAAPTTTRSTTCSTWRPGPPGCPATRPRSG